MGCTYSVSFAAIDRFNITETRAGSVFSCFPSVTHNTRRSFSCMCASQHTKNARPSARTLYLDLHSVSRPDSENRSLNFSISLFASALWQDDTSEQNDSTIENVGFGLSFSRCHCRENQSMRKLWSIFSPKKKLRSSNTLNGKRNWSSFEAIKKKMHYRMRSAATRA